MYNKTKKVIAIILAILMIVVLSSCDVQKKSDEMSYFQYYNFNALDYVDLYDYKNIKVDSEYIEVSRSDINTVIEMDLEYYDCMKAVDLSLPEEDFYVHLQMVDVKSNTIKEMYYLIGSDEFGNDFEYLLKKTGISQSFDAYIDGEKTKITNMGVYEPATIEDEELILDFYKLETMGEVYKSIEEQTRINIIFHYMMDIIIENTKINELPTVLSSNYDENSASFWNDVIIYKAILEAEGKELTESEFEQALVEASTESDLTVSNVFEEYADSVLRFALEQKVKNILVKYINIY